jgi:hypothetical protein
LERVPEDDWNQINAEIHQAVQKYFDGKNLNFGVNVVLASGRKA